MNRDHRAASIALTGILGVWVTSMSAQIPRETSVYELVDIGPVAAPACGCIGAPFALPYRPQSGYSSGAATPLGPVPLSRAGYERAVRDYAKERQSIGRAAEDGLAGNPHATLGVAMHLSVEASITGENPRTEEETVRWLYLAAQQNHHDAFRLLGYRYAHGRGVAQDYQAAAHWFAQGARRDDPISGTALGLLLAAGRGVPQDWAAAVKWWEWAQSRTPLAARFAADAYACGLGTPQDHARAAATYKRVAELDPSAGVQLGHMYVNRCAEGGDEAAVKAFEAAADAGDPDAQVALSELVREGHGTPANPYRAYTLARLAELRLPDGDLKTRAAQSARSAARLTTREALEAQDAVVKALLSEAAKSIR